MLYVLKDLNSGVELKQTLFKQCRYPVRRPSQYDIINATKVISASSGTGFV